MIVYLNSSKILKSLSKVGEVIKLIRTMRWFWYFCFIQKSKHAVTHLFVQLLGLFLLHEILSHLHGVDTVFCTL